MAKELIYTSAPRGLFPGTSGFCTVQASAGISRPVIEMLESLSNHFRVPSSGGIRGITAISCVRARVGTADVRVVSRNAAAPADYSGRSNNLAHHLVIEGTESPPVRNAAALALIPGLLIKQWDGNVLTLPPRKLTSIGAADSGARSWKAVTGDAGWAKFVATAWLAEESPLHLIYDSQVDLLPLLAEAIEQMPESRRADATFTTYYSGLPLGITCQLRGVLACSEQEASARKQRYLVLADLVGKPAPEAKGAAVPSATEADDPFASPLQTRSAASLKGLPTIETKKGPPQVQGQLETRPPFRPGLFKVMVAAILASLLVNIGLGVLVALPAKEVAEVTQMLKEQAEKEKETIRKQAENELKTFKDQELKQLNERLKLDQTNNSSNISNITSEHNKAIAAKDFTIHTNQLKLDMMSLHEIESDLKTQLLQKNLDKALLQLSEKPPFPIGRLTFLPERTIVKPRDVEKTKEKDVEITKVLTTNIDIFFTPEPPIPGFAVGTLEFAEFAADGMPLPYQKANELKSKNNMNWGSDNGAIKIYFFLPGDYTKKAGSIGVLCREMLENKYIVLNEKQKVERKDLKKQLEKAFYYNKFDFSNLK